MSSEYDQLRSQISALGHVGSYVVLVDWDNLSSTLPKRFALLHNVMVLLEPERVEVYRAFALDFGGAEAQLRRIGVQPIAVPRIRRGKNNTDMALAANAFGEALEQSMIAERCAFVIVSDDSDFFLVAQALRDQGFVTIGVIKDPSGVGMPTDWYDSVVSIHDLMALAPTPSANDGAAHVIFQELAIPAFNTDIRRKLAELTLATCGVVRGRSELSAALQHKVNVPASELSLWVDMVIDASIVIERKQRLVLASGLNVTDIMVGVDGAIVSRLKNHHDAQGLRDTLRALLGFAGANQARRAVKSLLSERSAQSPWDAGLMTMRLQRDYAVQPWLLGFSRVKSMYQWLATEGVVELHSGGSTLLVRRAGVGAVKETPS